MYACVCAHVQTYFSSLLRQTCTTGTFLLVGLLFLLFLYVEHFWSLRCFFLTAFVWKAFFSSLSFVCFPLSLFHTHTHTRTCAAHTQTVNLVRLKLRAHFGSSSTFTLPNAWTYILYVGPWPSAHRLIRQPKLMRLRTPLLRKEKPVAETESPRAHHCQLRVSCCPRDTGGCQWWVTELWVTLTLLKYWRLFSNRPQNSDTDSVRCN